MSTELAYDLTSSRGVLCPLPSAACVILPEASGGRPTLWLEPSPSQAMFHLLELCKYIIYHAFCSDRHSEKGQGGSFL